MIVFRKSELIISRKRAEAESGDPIACQPLGRYQFACAFYR